MPSPERTNNQTESARQTSLIQTLAHTLTVLDHARDFLVLSPQQVERFRSVLGLIRVLQNSQRKKEGCRK